MKKTRYSDEQIVRILWETGRGSQASRRERLESEVMKEINAKEWYAISRGVCQRRACALMEVSCSGLYYTPAEDADEGGASGSGHATPVRTISALWIALYPRIPRSRRHLGRQGVMRTADTGLCRCPPSGPVRSLGHACQRAETVSGATSCSTLAPMVRHLNV